MIKLLKYLFLFCCLFVLCGCQQKHDKMTVIRFSTWGSASEINILTPIIKEFEQENPNIKIELLHIPQNYFQKIHLLFASNLAPDVVFINNLNLPVYADHLEALGIDKSLYYKQSVDALSYNGHVYAVPRDVSNLVIYYNKDIFNKCGIKYPNNKWTLEDLLQIAQLTKKHGYWCIGYEEDMYYALPYILTLGGSIYSSESVKTQKGFVYYTNLAYKYHYAPVKSEVGSKTVAQLFLEGKIAMHLSGRWMSPKYYESAKFDWGVINFPGIVPCDASGWAISKKSKNKDAALKFVDFLSSKENIEKMTKSGLIVPARIDVPFKDKPFIDAVAKSITLQITPAYNKTIGKLNDTVFLNNP